MVAKTTRRELLLGKLDCADFSFFKKLQSAMSELFIFKNSIKIKTKQIFDHLKQLPLHSGVRSYFTFLPLTHIFLP